MVAVVVARGQTTAMITIITGQVIEVVTGEELLRPRAR